MNHVLRTIVYLIICLTCGCASTDYSFSRHAPPKALLVIVGGNSECTGDAGLWHLRETIASDVAANIGIERVELSTAYFSWVGDEGHVNSASGCITVGGNWLKGESRIKATLNNTDLFRAEIPIIIVGWSNGGATAALLSNMLTDQNKNPNELLITLDPVSVLTARPKTSRALLWINVFSSNEVAGDRNFADIIIKPGHPWKKVEGPDVQFCIESHHNDLQEMWAAAIAPNPKLAEWVNGAIKNPSHSYKPYPRTPSGPFEPCLP